MIAACLPLCRRIKPAPEYRPVPLGVITIYSNVALMAVDKIGVKPGTGFQNTRMTMIWVTPVLPAGLDFRMNRYVPSRVT